VIDSMIIAVLRIYFLNKSCIFLTKFIFPSGIIYI